MSFTFFSIPDTTRYGIAKIGLISVVYDIYHALFYASNSCHLSNIQQVADTQFLLRYRFHIASAKFCTYISIQDLILAT